jgi:signal transduction histidine kinase
VGHFYSATTKNISTAHWYIIAPPFSKDKTSGKDVKKFMQIKFVDTGGGIEKNDLEKIFEPFFTTKPEGKGTGLGLSISYSIIERHGGNLEIDSKVGVGTTVTINLPIPV